MQCILAENILWAPYYPITLLRMHVCMLAENILWTPYFPITLLRMYAMHV